MRKDKAGKVVAPYNYRNWYAELCGDTDDTGGFYIFLWKDKEQKTSVEGYNHLLFWDITEEDVNKQLSEFYIEIEWDNFSA